MKILRMLFGAAQFSSLTFAERLWLIKDWWRTL